MTPISQGAAPPIVAHHPDDAASAEQWVEWFWSDFLPAWTDRAHDPDGIGFVDLLDASGQPGDPETRTLLAQARLLFTFSHLALMSKTPAFHQAARITRDALPHFLKAPGLYRRAVSKTGDPTGAPEDELAKSYDQSFVILGLSTWGKLNPDEDVSDALDACWAAVETVLTDPVTGLMLEHDGLDDPQDPSAPPRAQNPHMHLYEAALQAFEMTQDPVWLTRAATMRAKGIEYFFDADSGTITEFIAPDLTLLPGRDGQRREIGHQCEWAWLLMREAELGGDPSVLTIANRLLEFADQHGFATDGAMAGAAFDAVSCDASWREDRFLMWPQTEAIKTYAVRSDLPGRANADAAMGLVQLIFKRYFAGRPAFVNQLDGTGQPVWSDGLSRLHYHIVLALTEGARAGLWRYPD